MNKTEVRRQAKALRKAQATVHRKMNALMAKHKALAAHASRLNFSARVLENLLVNAL